jgi:hypothetical protein
MFVLILVLVVIFLLCIPNVLEHFDYKNILLHEAHANKCLPGYILSNCKQSTPKITTTLDSISTICECTQEDRSGVANYNVQFNST